VSIHWKLGRVVFRNLLPREAARVSVTWLNDYWCRIICQMIFMWNCKSKQVFNNCFFRCLESHWFVWVSQSNHVPMDIEEDKERPWLALQVYCLCYQPIGVAFFNILKCVYYKEEFLNYFYLKSKAKIYQNCLTKSSEEKVVCDSSLREWLNVCLATFNTFWLR